MICGEFVISHSFEKTTHKRKAIYTGQSMPAAAGLAIFLDPLLELLQAAGLRCGSFDVRREIAERRFNVGQILCVPGVLRLQSVDVLVDLTDTPIKRCELALDAG